ncbi:MAG: FAD binding domain-containing protein, partial [Halobacteriaceae archaeon]
MKPASFQYYRPSTIDETATLLNEYGHDAELMAGNQSLGIIMANRLATPDHII